MRFLAAFILFLISTVVSGQNGFSVGHIEPKQFYEEIPFESASGLPLVKVIYEGAERVFLFDTGAQNVLFEEPQNAKNEQRARIEDSNLNSREAKLVHHQSFRLGNIHFTEQAFLVSTAEDNFMKDCLHIYGIIGSNAVRNAAVKIDYSQQKIIIADDVKKISTAGFSDYKMEKTVKHAVYPYLTLTYDADKRVEVAYLIDTGFTSGIDLTPKAYEVLKANGGIRSEEEGTGISALGLYGANQNADLLRVTTVPVKIGNAVIENHVIRVSESQDSKLGYEVLRLLDPIIDFKRNKIYLKNTISRPDFPAEEHISIIYRDGKTVVSSLWGYLMDQATIGDEVLEINGQQPKVASLCDVILQRPVNGWKTVKLKSGDGKVKVLQRNN